MYNANIANSFDFYYLLSSSFLGKYLLAGLRCAFNSNGVRSYMASAVGTVVLDILAVIDEVWQAYEGPAAGREGL